MTDKFYLAYYDSISSNSIRYLNENVCPLLNSAIAGGSTSKEWYYPTANYLLLDLIHGLSVAQIYSPRKFKYGYIPYFLVSAVAMAPSYTLRSILLGEPWAVAISSSLFPCLILSTLLVYYFGDIPSPLATFIFGLNSMSSVVSVESGVSFMQLQAHITGAGSFFLGIINGAGGAIWNTIVNAWFGDGVWRWQKLRGSLPKWILLSLVWNIFFWSNCKAGLAANNFIEWTLFALLVLDFTYSTFSEQTVSAPTIPKKPSKIVPPIPSQKKDLLQNQVADNHIKENKKEKKKEKKFKLF